MSELLGPIDYAKIAQKLREELRFLGEGFIREVLEMEFGTDRLRPGALNRFYNARLSHYDEAGNYLYVEYDIELTKYWDFSKLKLPPNCKFLAIYSRIPVSYPFINSYQKYPNWVGMGYDDESNFYVGFENGGGAYGGIASWVMKKYTTNRLYAYVGVFPVISEIEQTVSLPADYLTANHSYWVKVNSNQIWFGINTRIRAVALLTKSGVGRILYNNSKPYTIAIIPSYVPEAQYILTELHALKGGKMVGVEIELNVGNIRWCKGDPKPPLAMPMYVEATDTRIAGYSLSTGTLTTHPFPVFGYARKTFYFMANQSGTLEVQVMTQSGNWRTYDSFSYSANQFLNYPMAGDVLLARLLYTPSVYPATVNEGEVVAFD